MTSLAALAPRGLWRGPLTDEQLYHATMWGIDQAAVADDADPFTFWLERMKVLVTVATPFERVSTYAKTMTSEGRRIDPAATRDINADATFVEHYALRFTSKVATLSILRFTESDGKRQHERMTGVQKWKSGGTRNQVALFKYPATDTAIDSFEIVATKMLLFATGMTTFEVNFADLH